MPEQAVRAEAGRVGGFEWPEGRPTELARAMAYGILDPLTRGLVLLTGRRVTVRRVKAEPFLQVQAGYAVSISGKGYDGSGRYWIELPEDAGPVETAHRVGELIAWALDNAAPLPEAREPVNAPGAGERSERRRLRGEGTGRGHGDGEQWGTGMPSPPEDDPTPPVGAA